MEQERSESKPGSRQSVEAAVRGKGAILTLNCVAPAGLGCTTDLRRRGEMGALVAPSARSARLVGAGPDRLDRRGVGLRGLS